MLTIRESAFPILSEMPKEIFPSSFECDCGYQSHFFENTTKEMYDLRRRLIAEYRFQVNLAILPNRIQVAHRTICAATHAAFL